MDINITRVGGREFAIVDVDGVFDLEAARNMAEGLTQGIPFDFDGNIIIDLRNTLFQLDDDTASSVFETAAEKARFVLRKPHAVLVAADGYEHTWSHYKAIFERGGMIFREFTELDPAIAWLVQVDE